MDGPRVWQPEWSISEKERQISHDITYTQKQTNRQTKKIQMNSFSNRKRLTHRKQIYYYQTGKGGEE